jgi:hypothetical protein
VADENEDEKSQLGRLSTLYATAFYAGTEEKSLSCFRMAFALVSGDKMALCTKKPRKLPQIHSYPLEIARTI